MDGRRAFPVLLLVLLTLAAAHLARALTAQPASDHLPALWLLGNQGVAKLAAADASVTLTLPDSADADTLAVDRRSGAVWIYGHGRLRGYDASGRATVSLPVAATADDPPHTALALAAEDGALWLAQHKSLFHFGPDGALRWSKEVGEVTRGVAAGAGGTAWVLLDRKLAAFDAAGTLAAELPFAPGDAGNLLAYDPETQTLWVGSQKSLLRYDAAGRLVAQQPLAGITRLAPDGRGGLWIGAEQQLFHLAAGGGLSAGVRPFGPEGGRIAALAANLADGSVWAADARRLTHLSGSGAIGLQAGHSFEAPLALAHYADITAPRIAITAPAPGSLLTDRQPPVSLSFEDGGIGADPGTLELRAQGEPLAAGCSVDAGSALCRPARPLPEGGVRLGAAIADLSGNRAEAAPVDIVIDATPPLITLQTPSDGLRVIDAELLVTGSLNEPAVVTVNGLPAAQEALAFSRRLTLVEGQNSVTVAATDPAGNRAALQRSVFLETGPSLPPDPATVAPPLNPLKSTSFAAATEFLYTGPNPIQTGVAPGTIEARRSAVIRGRVIDRDGRPLPGTAVTIKDHPELGATLSRADGAFDLVVNGGATLVLDYRRAGYLPAQRLVPTTWADYAFVEEVALVELDPSVTAVDLSGTGGLQVARGSPMADADGARQATLLFPPGVQGELVLADGSRQPLTGGAVRATEYTVGPHGPKAMPGELPPTSGYTYAVELSLDEALAAGAKEVRFDRPVYLYVDNFLGFATGGAVPAGWYDRERAAWVPSGNGRVIKVLGVEGALALLDLSGAGVAADATALAELGITEGERERIAQLYAPGASFWRTPISHFTPWDCNWPFGPPPGAEAPEPPRPNTKEEKPDCEAGSIIECQNRVLGESVPIIGTGLRLNYRSDRVPGHQEGRTITVPVTGETVPADLLRVVTRIDVAGRRHEQNFPPAPAQMLSFTWDGEDGFGRPVTGQQEAKVSIGFVYQAQPYDPAELEAAFGLPGTSYSSGRARTEVTIWRSATVYLNGLAAANSALGGWTLDAHHNYDPLAGVLYRGDGSRVPAGSTVNPISTTYYSASLSPEAIAVSPDGAVWAGNHYGMRKIVDGRSVGSLSLDGWIVDVEAGRDDELYVATGIYTGSRIWRYGSGGGELVAGTGVAGYAGDGGPASAAQINVSGIGFARDGSVYIAEGANHRVRRIGSDGTITTIAGSGTAGSGGDGGPAGTAQQPRRRRHRRGRSALHRRVSTHQAGGAGRCDFDRSRTPWRHYRRGAGRLPAGRILLGEHRAPRDPRGGGHPLRGHRHRQGRCRGE